MERIFVKEIFDAPEKFGGKTITVAGWVKNIRASNAFGFIELGDGSCFKPLQVVFEESKIENYKEIAKQNISAALSVTGILELTPDAPQPFELKADSVVVEGSSAPEYPL